MQAPIDPLACAAGEGAAFARLLGPRGWLEGADAAPFTRDWLDRFGVPPLGVARPATTEAVAATVRLAAEHGLAIVPQGGNTGLCGGAVAGSGRAIVLSLSRMEAIGAVDAVGGTVAVEGGVVLAALHEALEAHGAIFPMHLGAEGSARIGGLIGTNAGGSQAFRYGMMADLVLGLEVVLADGSVWNGLRAVQKDNAGYPLRRLFCGAEGTLGIVTRAVLRLFPAPAARTAALLALPDMAAAVAFGSRLRARCGEFVAAAEFFSEEGVRLLNRHLPEIDFPLADRAPIYLLVELATTSSRVPLDEILEAELASAMEEELVLDGAIAATEAQRLRFWRIREDQPEGQRLEGLQLKHDIAVPPGRLADFFTEAAALCEAMLPSVRINPFGHLLDGNVHYNLSPPDGAESFGDAGPGVGEALARLSDRMGGSFAAEHGLGRSKIELAESVRSSVERDLMRHVKGGLDPDWRLNPGVVIERAKKEELSE